MSDERRPHRDEQVLRDLYHRAGLSQREIAECYGVSSTTISCWMERHDIETRGRDYMAPSEPYQYEQVLRDMYDRAGLSMQEVADYLGVTQSTVYHWLKRHDIERHAQGRRKTGPVTDEQVLRDLYWRAGLNMKEIADYYGSTKETVKKYMREHEIDIRGPGNWNGFINHHSYEGRGALDFDGDPPHTCPECGNEYETRTAQHECIRAHSREHADELRDSGVF